MLMCFANVHVNVLANIHVYVCVKVFLSANAKQINA